MDFLEYKIPFLNRIANKFLNTPHYWNVGAINRKLLAEAQNYRPDFILLFKPILIKPETVDALREITKTFSWYPDYVKFPKTASSYFYASIPRYDAHFSFNYANSVELEKLGAKYIQGQGTVISFRLDSREYYLQDGKLNGYANMQAVADRLKVAYTREAVSMAAKRAGWNVERDPFPFVFVPPPVLQQLTPVSATYETGAFTGTGTGDVTGNVVPVDINLVPPRATTSGCEAADFAGFPAGAIALIQRGTCNFSVKALNAEAAGAGAVIIFNQGDTPLREGLIVGTLGGTRIRATNAVISRDGQRVIAGYVDGSIRVFPVPATVSVAPETTRYTNAKVLLVGETGDSDSQITAWYADKGHRSGQFGALLVTLVASLALVWFASMLRVRLHGATPEQLADSCVLLERDAEIYHGSVMPADSVVRLFATVPVGDYRVHVFGQRNRCPACFGGVVAVTAAGATIDVTVPPSGTLRYALRAAGRFSVSVAIPSRSARFKIGSAACAVAAFALASVPMRLSEFVHER